MQVAYVKDVIISDTTIDPARPRLAEPRSARPRAARTAVVVRRQRLTPTMIRVVLGGPDVASLPLGPFTDSYVKLAFPPPGAPYHSAAELSEQRDSLAAAHRPALRTYTVRNYDGAAGELTIDLVTHGDEGLAGRWAEEVSVGDEVWFFGPGGGYAPSPEADWHLLIGDESALPAIAAALERLAPGDRAQVFLEVADAAEEQPLPSAATVTTTWLHRTTQGSQRRGSALVPAVRAAQLPSGRVDAFVHGEAGFVKELRHHLRFDRGISRDQLSVSGYWRQGRTDEGWRAEKATWKAEVEADEQQHAG